MYTISKHSDELYHYGVLGMKWGVRRYQNYDGTRIGTGGKPVTDQAKRAGNTVALGQGGNAKGNARFAASAVSPKTKEAVDKLTNPSVKQGKGRDDITPAEKITRDTKKGADATKDIVSIAEKHANKRSKEAAQEKQMQKAKKMSDKELRDSINRIKMEREYTSLTTKETESGWTKAKEVLEVVGDVAEIAGAVVGVYVMLKKAGIIHSDMTFEEFQNEVDPEFIMHFIAMDDEYVDDFLEHYGVLGMKWGVRRYQNYDGTRIGAGKNPVIDQVKKAGSAMSTSRQMNANAIRPGGSSPKNSTESRRGVGTGIGGGAGGALKRTGSGLARSQQIKVNSARKVNSSIGDALNRTGSALGRSSEVQINSVRNVDKKIDKLIKKYENVKLDQLAASPKKLKEPEGYSLKRQLKEDSIRKEIKKAKPLSSTRLEKRRELNSYKLESRNKAEEYAQYEKDVYKKTGSLRNYTPETIDGKRTGKWVNKRTGQVITQKEYNLAGNYETLPIHRKLRLK